MLCVLYVRTCTYCTMILLLQCPTFHRLYVGDSAIQWAKKLSFHANFVIHDLAQIVYFTGEVCFKAETSISHLLCTMTPWRPGKLRHI